jgi:hypothetical protein
MWLAWNVNIAHPFFTSASEFFQMSTLRRQEPIGKGLKRIACGQVESAIRCLTRQAGQAVGAEEAIDQAQAVLSLIEPELPRQAVRKERGILARLSAGLSEMTEPERLLQQLEREYKKTPSEAELASAVKSLRKQWSSKVRSSTALSSKAGNFNPMIYRLVADMAELRGHLDHWSVEEVADDAPPRGLRRTYTKARRLAHEPVTADSLTALARVLGELAVQVGVISKACPVMLKAQRKMLSRASEELMSELLMGRLHQALRAELGKGASKVLPGAAPLSKRVARVIEAEVTPALAESPAAFIGRMQNYWSVWRSETTE